MAGIIDHESMLTDTGMETVTDSNTTNLLQNIMASSYLTTTTTNSTSTNTTINTQRTLSYPLAQSSTSINPHSHTEMSMHTGMGQRLPDSATAMLKDPSTDSLRFDYTMDEENQFSSTKQRPKKTAPTVYREQERFVPINNTGRVMRNAVPRNAKISKDSKQCMQECISEFISFLTSEASDRCIDEKRKTITGDDILYGLSTLGFDSYVQPMQQYLKKYREFLHFDKPGSKESESYQLEEEDTILRASLQEDQTQVNAHTLQLLTGQLPATSQSSLPRL